MDTLKTELITKRRVPTFGGYRLEVDYEVQHFKNNRYNVYMVTFEVLVSHTFSGYAPLNLIKVVRENNNEETLTDDGVAELLDI